MEYFFLRFQEFSLYFSRLLAMMSVAPLFSGQSFSFFYRVALSFLVSSMILPILTPSPEFYDKIQNQYFILIAQQIFIGLLIGFSLQVLFGAFQMAGEFFSVQMGFGISEVFDPLSQISLPLMGTIKNMMAIYVFLISGSHLLLIKAVVYSIEKTPYIQKTISAHADGVIEYLILLTSAMFLIALKIALPIMGTLFMVSLTLGLLSKTAPQMNILMLGFPIKILIGFIVIAGIAPVFIHLMQDQLDIFFNQIDTLIENGII